MIANPADQVPLEKHFLKMSFMIEVWSRNGKMDTGDGLGCDVRTMARRHTESSSSTQSRGAEEGKTSKSTSSGEESAMCFASWFARDAHGKYMTTLSANKIKMASSTSLMGRSFEFPGASKRGANMPERNTLNRCDALKPKGLSKNFDSATCVYTKDTTVESDKDYVLRPNAVGKDTCDFSMRKI